MSLVLKSVFPRDANDQIIICPNNHVNIEGDVTDLEIFADEGLLFALEIIKDVDGGTWTLKDKDGNAIFPAGMLDYAGKVSFGGANGYPLRNGCYITTASATGLVAVAFFAE